MIDLVPPDRIEQIVGRERHPTRHYGRAVTAETVLYILHSQECKTSGVDLRECPFSQALVRGIRMSHEWEGHTDVPVLLTVWGGWLVPDFRTEIVLRGPDDGHPMCRHTENGEPYCGEPECDIYYCPDCGFEFEEPCPRHIGVRHEKG